MVVHIETDPPTFVLMSSSTASHLMCRPSTSFEPALSLHFLPFEYFMGLQLPATIPLTHPLSRVRTILRFHYALILLHTSTHTYVLTLHNCHRNRISNIIILMFFSRAVQSRNHMRSSLFSSVIRHPSSASAEIHPLLDS